MNSSPSNIPPQQSAPSSASTLQRFFRVLPAFIAGGLTMTGVHALILMMALALIRAMESQAAAESPPVRNGLIALTLRDPARPLQIFTIRPDGTGKQQSPDGKKILPSTGRSGRNEFWVMDTDGKNQRKVHDIDAFPFPGRASWQPGR